MHVDASNDFPIGMVVDIEGNCRFYDLIRFKKLAKIKCAIPRVDGDVHKFKLMPHPMLMMTSDCFLGVVNEAKIFRDPKLDET